MNTYTVIGTRDHNGFATAVAILIGGAGVLPIDNNTWIEVVEADSVHDAWNTAVNRVEA